MAFPYRCTIFAILATFFLSHTQAEEPQISLQWAICESSASAVLQKLGYPDKPPYKANPIVYYDTWPPALTASGLAFRTKVKKHDPGWPISMIKARFGELNENVPSEAHCVWNRYGNDTSYTCGLSSILSEIGGAEGESVWSEAQVAFAQRYQDVEWEALVPFGPYVNPKWKVHVLGHKAVFDDVRALPEHLMEIEIGVGKEGSEGVYEEITRFLRERAIVLCERQLPKTLRLFEALKGEEGDGDGGLEIGRGGEQALLGKKQDL